MGSKGSATTNSTSAPPQAVQDMYKYITEQGKALQQTPYQQYTGDLVAPMNSYQQQALDQTQSASQAAQPYIQAAGGLTAAAQQGYTPQGFQQNIGSYMSPYLSNVIGATANQLNNINQQQQQGLIGNTIKQGAFGGDRGKIAQAELMNQQNLASGQVLGGLAQTGYNQAAQNLNAGLQGQLTGAAQLGQIGQSAQQQALAGAGALGQAGTVPYNIAQGQLAANYGQFAQQQAYPQQTLGFLANIAAGLGAGQGGTSSTTAPGPNQFTQGLGALGTIGSLFSYSDERLKDNIKEVGKTFDGQPIYSYNYKGDPQTHVGLIAQDVEKKHPDAVKEVDGYKMVNYAEATEDAAKRGHFADGGSSMGGLVPATMERYPYASGGNIGLTPYIDDPLYQLMVGKSPIQAVSYIPAMDSIRGGGVGIPRAPAPYDDPDVATPMKSLSGYQEAGLGKLGSALKSQYLNTVGISGNDPRYLYGASGYTGMGPFTGNYASGGLVPRTHHADGDVATGVVPANPDAAKPDINGTIFEHLYGKNFSPEVNMGLMSAFANMLGSRSPYTGVGIGQGINAGMDTYQNAIKNKYAAAKDVSEIGLQGAQTAEQLALASAKPQEVAIAGQQADTAQRLAAIGSVRDIRTLYKPVSEMVNGQVVNYMVYGNQKIPLGEFETTIDALLRAGKIQPDLTSRTGRALGGPAIDENNNDSEIAAPILAKVPDNSFLPQMNGPAKAEPKPIMMAEGNAPVKTDAQVDAGKNPYPDIAAGYTPSDYMKQYDNYMKLYENQRALGQEGADQTRETALKMKEMANAISKGEAPTTLSNGTIDFPPSILAAKRARIAQDKINEEQAVQASNATTEAANFLRQLSPAMQTQEGLINAYQKIDMNRTAGFKADVIGLVRDTPALNNTLRAAGIDVNSDGFQGLADTAAKDAIVNAFRNLAADAAAKTTNMQLKESLMSVAEPTKDPAAKYQVITQERANMLRNEQMYRDWVNSGGTTPYAKFVADWTANPDHKQKVFDQAAVDQIDYFKGMTPQDVKNLPYKRQSSEIVVGASPATKSRLPWMANKGSFSYDPSNNQYVDSLGQRFDSAGKKVQ